jgi:hypothetical protein
VVPREPQAAKRGDVRIHALQTGTVEVRQRQLRGVGRGRDRNLPSHDPHSAARLPERHVVQQFATEVAAEAPGTRFRNDLPEEPPDAGREALASCSGFVVEASDGRVGEVEIPLFPPDRSVPDYLLLRASGFLIRRRPLVPTELVEDVDTRRRRIRIRGSRNEIESLPERLPLAI